MQFYTQYPLNADKDSRVSWYGCADSDYTVLNYEATYNDKMKALECKGKQGQPEVSTLYIYIYIVQYSEYNNGKKLSNWEPFSFLRLHIMISF